MHVSRFEGTGSVTLGAEVVNALNLNVGSKLYFYPLKGRPSEILVTLFELEESVRQISAILADQPGAFTTVTRKLAEKKADFVYSSARIRQRKVDFHWEAIADFKNLTEEEIESIVKETGLLLGHMICNESYSHRLRRLHSIEVDIEKKCERSIISRSRITIPAPIRKEVGIEDYKGRVYAFVTLDTECAAIFISFSKPEDHLKKLFVRIRDDVGSMASVAEHLFRNKFDALISEKRIRIRGVESEWMMVTDLSKFLESHPELSNIKETKAEVEKIVRQAKNEKDELLVKEAILADMRTKNPWRKK